MAANLPSAIAQLSAFFGLLPGVPFTTATLSGAHTSAVTTITLTATVPTDWPTAGAVYINNECVEYTGKSGATLTGCTRGRQGTTAAAQTDGTTVRCGITKGTINQIIEELVVLARIAAFPAREDLAGGAQTIDLSDTTKAWNRWYRLTGNPSITLSNPPTRGWVTFLMEQDATGGRTPTWVTTINWKDGTAPAPNTGAGKFARYDLMWTGTDWLGDYAYNWK